MRTHVIIAAALLVLFAGFSTAESAVGPKLVVAEPVHDLGTVFEDTKITHDFVIKNEGDQELIIEKIPTS